LIGFVNNYHHWPTITRCCFSRITTRAFDVTIDIPSTYDTCLHQADAWGILRNFKGPAMRACYRNLLVCTIEFSLVLWKLTLPIKLLRQSGFPYYIFNKQRLNQRQSSLNRCLLLLLKSLVFLLSKPLRLFGLENYIQWAYRMKVIPETRCAH